MLCYTYDEQTFYMFNKLLLVWFKAILSIKQEKLSVLCICVAALDVRTDHKRMEIVYVEDGDITKHYYCYCYDLKVKDILKRLLEFQVTTSNKKK